MNKYILVNEIKQAFFSVRNKTSKNIINLMVILARQYVTIKPGRKSIAKAIGVKSVKTISRHTEHLVSLKILIKKGISDLGTCIYELNPIILEYWINFCREIPALSVLIFTPKKPVSINDVPLINKDKGIIYDSCPENVLNNYQHFLVNNPDLAFAHKPTPQQGQAFSEILEKIFKEPEKQVDIAREALVCSPPPNIFLKNEGYDTRQYQSDLAGLLDGLTRRIRVDLKISKFLT